MSYKPIRLQTVSVRTGEQLQTVPVRTVLAYEHTVVELKNLYCLASGANVYEMPPLVLEGSNTQFLFYMPHQARLRGIAV